VLINTLNDLKDSGRGRKPNQGISRDNLGTLCLLHLGTMAIDDGFLRDAVGPWRAHLREFECGIPWVGGTEESRDLRLEREREQKPEEQMQEQEQPGWEGAQDLDQEDVSSAPSAKLSALQVLNVRDSPIDNPECVAKYLKRVASVLHVICVEGSLDMWRKWREDETGGYMLKT